MVEQVSFDLLHAEGPVVPAKLASAQARARRLLALAKAEATCIRETACREVEAAREEARHEVRERSRRWMRRRLRRLARADHLRRVRLCEASVEACLAVAEKVWEQVPADRGPVIRAVAREMLALAPAGQTLELHLHPDDLGLAPEGVRACAHPELEAGDVIGRTEGGGFDGRVRSRAGLALDALARRLQRIREGQVS